MFALEGLALYWVEYPIPMILILRPNANTFVWMCRQWKSRHDIEVEYQMLFGWSRGGISVIGDFVHYTVCKQKFATHYI
jgi:hypothetical protein